MKEKIINNIRNIVLRQKRALVIAIVVVLIFFTAEVSALYLLNKSDSKNISIADDVSSTNLNDSNLTIAVVGEEESLILGNTTSNNSWPGEIISLNNLQVQPDREGTISEWYVHIGERVSKGQVMGKLSRPPQTPEMINMLSEKSQMLREARTSIEALRIFTKKRISQLQKLRIDTENSNRDKIDLLRPDVVGPQGASLSLIASKRKLAQAILQGSITRAFPIISGQNVSALSGSNYNVQLKWAFGPSNSDSRDKFTSSLLSVLSDLKKENIVPEKSGLVYFDSALKLANVAFIDNEILTGESLESLKQMLVEDQAEFISVLGEIKNMELERVNTQRESIDTLVEIDAMIIELEKELTMSEGELKAKEIAYATSKESISSGYSIVAPNSGVISSIMKKPGEFVGPGMPVATVTAGGNSNVLVRMRIPNNIQRPQIGELLSIVRPGFGTDVQKVKLVGIGNSLDTDGSYMADAVFAEATKWSVGASVRILAPVSSSVVLITNQSVFWSEEGVPAVWAISEADRIFKKTITIGRTLGSSVEVYTGLKNGDRYIANPTTEIKENMLLSDLIKNSSIPAKSGEGEEMGGMEM